MLPGDSHLTSKKYFELIRISLKSMDITQKVTSNLEKWGTDKFCLLCLRSQL